MKILVEEDLERIKKKVWGQFQPPQVIRKMSGIGPDRTTEMSDYFDYAQYDKATRAHPFYQDMIEAMLQSLKEEIKKAKRRCEVLELGCGSGTLTERIVHLPNTSITSIDVDENAIEFVKARLRESNLKLVRADALRYRREEPFDIVISSWTYEQITNYENGSELAESVLANLKDDGLYIKGAELIAPFENEFERQKAFISYHEDIIDRALKEGKQDTAEIEYLCIVSGITGVCHFKRDKETLVREMEMGGLKLKNWRKFGPFTENVGSGGIYFFEFEPGETADAQKLTKRPVAPKANKQKPKKHTI